jgi:hypothetical protein
MGFVEALRLFRSEAVDSEASRRAATWALTPLAALAIGVSFVGLAVNKGGPGSGSTSLIALLLVGAGLAAGHVAALRTKKAQTVVLAGAVIATGTGSVRRGS